MRFLPLMLFCLVGDLLQSDFAIGDYEKYAILPISKDSGFSVVRKGRQRDTFLKGGNLWQSIQRTTPMLVSW